MIEETQIPVSQFDVQVCPNCRLVDRFEQITAAVSHTQPPLRYALSPPEPPRYKSPWSLSLLMVTGGLVLISCVAFGNASSANGDEPAFLTALGFIMLIIGGGFFVWRFALWRHRRAEFQRATAQWQADYARWQTLKYCHRCDLIVDLARHRIAPSMRLATLLEQDRLSASLG
jgi:hypothetical protein